VEQHESFEQRLTRIKEIVNSIENGQMPLEESVRQFETGIQQLNELEKELTEMKRRITILQHGEEKTVEDNK
jgi:exodeoxyribonuclease VII small subunit